eukprot:scaffold2364_cov74-Cylindrotheca_fusiformis.AAC.2
MKQRVTIGITTTATVIFCLLVGSINAFSYSSNNIGGSKRTTTTTTTIPAALQTRTQTSSLLFSPNIERRHDIIRKSSSSSLTQLHAVAAATATPAAFGAVAGILTGGLFAGGLHAIAGTYIIFFPFCPAIYGPTDRLPRPDHLAALLPRCCGQRWYKAGKIGALWGMGHGVSATILGVLAFGLKAQVQKAPGVKAWLAGASHVMEIAVGLSLIVIGGMGMREAREWEDEISNHQHTQSLSAAASDVTGGVSAQAQKRAVIFNGLLHGFSWDGAPSLAPALAVATWGGNLAFLSAYAAGTMTTMAITTTLIGEGTRRAGEIFNRPDFPQKLSYVSSLLAIAIGLVWCGLALKP